MPSEDSSPEGVICECGDFRFSHSMAGTCQRVKCDCSGFKARLTPAAPPGSASSSPDEPQGICRCGHGAAYHDAKYSDPQCRLCPSDGERMWRHAFVPVEPGSTKLPVRWKNPQRFTAAEAADAVRPRHEHCFHSEEGADVCCDCKSQDVPADAETAGEPEAPCPCAREGGCCHAPGVCLHGCRQAADDLTRLGQEVEADLHQHCPHWESGASGDVCCECSETMCSRCAHAWHGDGSCGAEGCFCGHVVPEPEAPVLCHCGIGTPEECATGPAGCGPDSGDPRPPRRPPYAVAYVLQDGTHFEVALPGDATVCALDGALLITHTQSPVQGLTQARPMEGA